MYSSRRPSVTHLSIAILLATTALTGLAQDSRPKPRARDLGVPFDGTPGPLNALTDVPGIEVGQVTLISGEGRRGVTKDVVRTGLTAILPRGRNSADPVAAGCYALNGNGEMTGTLWIRESGFLESPIVITNTHIVGVVRDAVIKARVKSGQPDASGFWWSLPVVAETYDGILNDVNGFHVKEEHVFTALDGARGGPIAEGNVGGGTGMVCHWFKGGIGTASRRVKAGGSAWTVGVLAQCNYGARHQLRIAGVPVGTEIPLGGPPKREGGSIIVVVATDAPLLPHQLERVARRVPLGVARMGGQGGDESGDLFIAFSTANPKTAYADGPVTLTMLPNQHLDPIFGATIEATEEAIVNCLVAAETMTGAEGRTVQALPHDRLREVLRKYGRLVETPK